MKRRSFRGWKVGAVLSEALRNVASAPGRNAVLVLIGVIAFLTVGTLETRSVAGTVDLVRTIEDSGGTVLIATERDRGDTIVYGGVDALACRRLSPSRDILNSGGLSGSASRQLGIRTPQGISVVRAEVGALRAMGLSEPITQGHVIVVPTDLARDFGLKAGSVLTVTRGGNTQEQVTVAAVVDVSARFPNRAASIYEVTLLPHGVVATCVAEVETKAFATLRRVLGPQLARPGQGIDVVPLRSGGIYDRDPAREFRDRSTLHLWVAGSVLLGFVSLLSMLSRRSDMALYRSTGMSRPAGLFLFSVEMITVVGASASIAWVALVTLATLDQTPSIATAYGLRSVALSLSASYVLVIPAVALATRGVVADMLKER